MELTNPGWPADKAIGHDAGTDPNSTGDRSPVLWVPGAARLADLLGVRTVPDTAHLGGGGGDPAASLASPARAPDGQAGRGQREHRRGNGDPRGADAAGGGRVPAAGDRGPERHPIGHIPEPGRLAQSRLGMAGGAPARPDRGGPAGTRARGTAAPHHSAGRGARRGAAAHRHFPVRRGDHGHRDVLFLPRCRLHHALGAALASLGRSAAGIDDFADARSDLRHGGFDPGGGRVHRAPWGGPGPRGPGGPGRPVAAAGPRPPALRTQRRQNV